MIISSALTSPSPTAALSLITCADVKPLFSPPGFTSPFASPGRKRSGGRVVVRSDGEASTSPSLSAVEEEKEPGAKIGARIRVKVPLKVYHVPKIPEVDLTGMEGELKQYVGVWKGKRISANFPFKAQFVIQVEDKGPVKFFAHLREDEFDYV